MMRCYSQLINLLMNNYSKKLHALLKADNWEEPTKDKYPTYLDAAKKHGRNAKAPYFEDIHFHWRNHKPTEA